MQAYIGRIEPVSGEHWHGGLSFTIFFAGCDYNCPNCNTPDILDTKEEFLLNLRDVKNDIKQYSDSIKAVVFTGGEPCLQRQALLTLATYAKDLDLKTGIETNGSKTECLRSLLRLGIIDYIALDLKSPFEPGFFERATISKTFFKDSQSLITDLKSTLRLLREYQDKVDIEFRTTVIPTLVSRKEDLLAIAEEIADIECNWVLTQYDPSRVVNRRFSDIKPPSVGFMVNLKDTIQKRNPKIRVTVQKVLS